MAAIPLTGLPVESIAADVMTEKGKDLIKTYAPVGKDALLDIWLGIVGKDAADELSLAAVMAWLDKADVQEMLDMQAALMGQEDSSLFVGMDSGYPSIEQALARDCPLHWLYPYPMSSFSVQMLEWLAGKACYEPYFSFGDDFIIPCTAGGRVGSLSREDGMKFLGESFRHDAGRLAKDGAWLNPCHSLTPMYEAVLSSILAEAAA